VSKAAAREINKHEATDLIFPAVDKNSNELEKNSLLNVANRIVAQVNNGNKDTVQDIITAGKEAAKNCLEDFFNEAKKTSRTPHQQGQKRERENNIPA
jgi:methionyl-tRNA synthetase